MKTAYDAGFRRWVVRVPGACQAARTTKSSRWCFVFARIKQAVYEHHQHHAGARMQRWGKQQYPIDAWASPSKDMLKLTSGAQISSYLLAISMAVTPTCR